jgi:hypothetical protein
MNRQRLSEMIARIECTVVTPDVADRVTETGETANEGGPLRMTSNALLVRKLVGENVNPVNFRRFGKEVARLGFFHQSRRHFAI